MKHIRSISIIFFLLLIAINQSGCNYVTHRTLATDNPYDSNKSDQDPNYNVSLDYKYQDFVGYFYMGNRVENFTAYFNTFYRSREDFDEAYDEYRSSIIQLYSRRLDSLGIVPPVSASVKEKLDKAIERSSKIIQYHKNSKYIDDAVLIIGKSYFYEGLYFQAERTFNEFLSKFSSSIYSDEAILFLGQTKIRIGKNEEGEKIFENLIRSSSNNEVQSLAARNMGIIEFNKRNYEEAVKYFRASIDFSKDKEKKAEGQFILAKILYDYKPELSAEEYKKVVDYSSDFDLTFYARLNYSRALSKNKKYSPAAEELDELRRKYRDEIGFTQLVDLEIANNLYAQKDYAKALDKYYEVIVKYPNSASASVAYYNLGKHDEEINNDYLNAFVNYNKAIQENTSFDYFNESSEKAKVFETYFALQDDVKDSGKVVIPTANADVEEYRRKYSIEKGIDIPDENTGFDNNQGNNKGDGTVPVDGSQTGDGKGKPGGIKYQIFEILRDSLGNKPRVGPADDVANPKGTTEEKNETGEGEVTDGKKADSLRAEEEALNLKTKEDKIFNAYFQLAELFIYNINKSDSAEYYLKLLLTKYPEPERQTKLLYTLGNFYKNNGKSEEANSIFEKIVSDFPNTIYASESRKILGLKSLERTLNPIDEIFSTAFDLLNEDKFVEAVSKLKEVGIKYPKDSMVAKSLYSIGWIFENKYFNKDSSLFYYTLLTEKFPESEYSAKVMPMLEYIASYEAQAKLDSTGIKPEAGDSTGIKPEAGDSTNVEKKELTNEEVKSEGGEEVKPEKVIVDPDTPNEENRLSQEEIDKLLKETETENPTGE